MDASSPVRKSVAYECGVGRSTEKWLCQFPRKDLVVLLDIVLRYFISRINWVNKTTRKNEIITIYDSVNHTRFPTEDHLPYWACWDNKDMKGDRADKLQEQWDMLRWQCFWGDCSAARTCYVSEKIRDWHQMRCHARNSNQFLRRRS